MLLADIAAFDVQQVNKVVLHWLLSSGRCSKQLYLLCSIVVHMSWRGAHWKENENICSETSPNDWLQKMVGSVCNLRCHLNTNLGSKQVSRLHRICVEFQLELYRDYSLFTFVISSRQSWKSFDSYNFNTNLIEKTLFLNKNSGL